MAMRSKRTRGRERACGADAGAPRWPREMEPEEGRRRVRCGVAAVATTGATVASSIEDRLTELLCSPRGGEVAPLEAVRARLALGSSALSLAAPARIAARAVASSDELLLCPRELRRLWPATPFRGVGLGAMLEAAE